MCRQHPGSISCHSVYCIENERGPCVRRSQHEKEPDWICRGQSSLALVVGFVGGHHHRPAAEAATPTSASSPARPATGRTPRSHCGSATAISRLGQSCILPRERFLRRRLRARTLALQHHDPASKPKQASPPTAVGRTATAEMRRPRRRIDGDPSPSSRVPAACSIQARLTGVPEGWHGFHIHETGACDPDFAAAGGHYDPNRYRPRSPA